MQVEEGKFYRDHNDEKIGPMRRSLDPLHPWGGKVVGKRLTYRIFTAAGVNNEPGAYDLVSEWSDESGGFAAEPRVLAELPSLTLAEVLRLAGGADPERVEISDGEHGGVVVILEPEKPLGPGEHVWTIDGGYVEILAIHKLEAWVLWNTGNRSVELLKNLGRKDTSR